MSGWTTSNLHSQSMQQSQNVSSQSMASSQMPQTSTNEINRGEDVRQWCEAFEKHELVEILVNIARNNTLFQSFLGHAFVTDIKWCQIRVSFNIDPSKDISSQVPTDEDLLSFFRRFGEIVELKLNTSEGHALITYNDYNCAQIAVTERFHDVPIGATASKLRMSSCYAFENPKLANAAAAAAAAAAAVGTKHAAAGAGVASPVSAALSATPSGHSQGSPKASSQTSGSALEPLEQRRLFVSSLSYDTLDETLINVFSQYGELEDCVIIRDKLTNRSRGYGFVVFKTARGAVNALKEPEKFIDQRRTRAWLASEGSGSGGAGGGGGMGGGGVRRGGQIGGGGSAGGMTMGGSTSGGYPPF